MCFLFRTALAKHARHRRSRVLAPNHFIYLHLKKMWRHCSGYIKGCHSRRRIKEWVKVINVKLKLKKGPGRIQLYLTLYKANIISLQFNMPVIHQIIFAKIVSKIIFQITYKTTYDLGVHRSEFLKIHVSGYLQKNYFLNNVYSKIFV